MTKIAIIGNAAVIRILSKKEFLKEPLFRYLITPTVLNTLNVFILWPANFLDSFFINQFDFSCKFYFFTNNMLARFSAYMNNLTSLETLIMVKYPTKFQFRKTFKYQIMIQLKVFSFSSLLSLPLKFFLNVNDGSCTGASDAPELSFYGNLYISILCISIPAILNVVISLIRFVLLRKKQLRINRIL